MKKTVLVIDLIGYSTIEKTIEDAQDAKLVHELHRQIQGFIDQGLATVGVLRDETEIAKTGDGAILAFDSAQIAHDCAATIHAATAAHNAIITQPMGKRVFRSGVATGQIDMKRLPQGGFDSAGGTISRAVRLEGNATPGALLVDSETFEALSLEQKARYGDRKEVKGKRTERYDTYECILNPSGVDDVSHFTFIPLPDSNIHRRITQFFGRDADLDAIGKLLEQHPLISLVGPGGSGKTRLAEEVCLGLGGKFPDGRWKVELASIVDPNLVPGAIAASLGLKEQQVRPPTDILSEYLSTRQTLLLLDNCEHLIAACRAVVQEILKKAPKARVLVTSTQELGVYGEKLWRVSPLPLPPRDTHDLETIEKIEAVQLFVERVKRRDYHFVLTSESAEPIIRICHFLGGMPLSIEIVAAQHPFLSLNYIADSLGETLRMEYEQGDAPRHKSVQATIEWSYRLLTEQHQHLLRCLSVFRGGFSIQAVSQVGFDVPLSESEAARVVSVLVKNSLVYLEDVAAVCDPSRRRFHLLETIREFGRNALPPDELSSLAVRHRDWCIQFAEQRAATLDAGGNQGDILRQIELEHDNIRAAMDCCTDNSDTTSGLRFGVAMWRFWEVRGYYAEGREELGKLVGVPRTEENAQLLGWASSGLGMLCYRQGQFPDAKKPFADALQIEQDRGDARRISNCLNDLGILAQIRGDFEDALRLYEQVLEIAYKQKDERQIGQALCNCGGTRLDLGEFALAKALLTEAKERFSKDNQQTDVGYPMNALGWVAFWQRDYKEAKAIFCETLANRTKIDSKLGMFDAVEGLCRTALEVGELEEARARLIEGLVLARELGAQLAIARQLENAALLTHKAGQSYDAVVFYAAAGKIRQSIGSPAPLIDQQVFDAFAAGAEAELTPIKMKEAQHHGRALSQDKLFDLAQSLRSVNHLIVDKP